MDKIGARYSDQAAFYNVYIREAHPADGWRSSSNDEVGIMIDQPKTIEERTQVAVQCCSALQMSIPLLVDGIDDRVNRAYCAFPDRLYIVDKAGRIAFKSGRGPFGYQPRAMEQSLITLLLAEQI